MSRDTSFRVAIVLGAAIAFGSLAAAWAAPTEPRAKSGVAKARITRSSQGHVPGTAHVQFRPSSYAAAHEAARLGALVGGCNGRADMQRNEHEWIVLCSNGRTYVVAQPPQTSAPAECSLAGIGPEPACFP